ncbi:FAD-dependent oxidoreductase [Rhizobium sp. TRM96647]|uniref:FAD-dependent oxidoreductase n=1 Tax=unclassified Rhizobium TaxID=2613769 RepID=UPI0021E87F31|nr:MULTISPECIES: FAD-dependent oxidoreductase [unclassified Rhizobium]MCV3736647.1 FAD-dependent oxidoreductase [Rhizobium sp. TRM96647]MCV3759016.1 FAD-dependent oxidoreductase [Rhizobium sp. TRM96650]
MERILVVGAGFAGACYARSLADAGYRVTVIDQRDHIAGNAYDYVDENGKRVHRYGPHLFHTSNETVVAWISRFGKFADYTHEVRAKLADGRHVPLPVNIDTINAVFSEALETAEQVEAFLAKISRPYSNPKNAAEYLYSKIGVDLTDLFFRPYTRKMWELDLEEMDKSVVQRIPIRFDGDRRYFPSDRFQLLPVDGYTAIFANILDHERIDVRLSQTFSKEMLGEFSHCFNSMPIDEFFGYEFGELPYRSIRLHHRTDSTAPEVPSSVVNFTDDGPITRETYWHLLPHHDVADTGRWTVTAEEPCDYKANNLERYYPVKTADGRYLDLYERYKKRAGELPNVDFIGRCGTYQYLDMHQVINQSLMGATNWLQRQ